MAADPDRFGDDRRSIASYFESFGPTPGWDELVHWPPDVFALTNLVLDHTESYRFVVAPPPGRHWPAIQGWEDEVRRAADAWSASGVPPPFVRGAWETVMRLRDVSLVSMKSGEPWDLTSALLTLHAAADQACAGIAARPHAEGSFEEHAWSLLQRTGSLSRLPPLRVRIVPKGHLSPLGITIRSLSRYLGLCYEAVDVRCRRVEGAAPGNRRDHHILLVPWPLSIRASDFRVARPLPLRNIDPDRFGFFEFAPEPKLEIEFVDSLLRAATAEAGRVDTVVFPECALEPERVGALEGLLERHGASLLVAGMRKPAGRSSLGRNYIHLGVRSGGGWSHYEQDKHHRWCLDASQIRQYHLSRSLHPKKFWWEAIDVRERTVHVVDVGGGVTIAPLVCEDLARLDEVADLLRRIGPSLVVALLLDGPQLAPRWPCRYASVIADDPGSAVLTLTSFGMAMRSCPPGRRRSRVIAHWNDRGDGLREIELAPRAAAALLSTAVEPYLLDGRRPPARRRPHAQALPGQPADGTTEKHSHGGFRSRPNDSTLSP